MLNSLYGFTGEVVGSSPGQRPVPQLEVHLIKHEARLAQCGGLGSTTQAWGSLQVGLSALGPPGHPAGPVGGIGRVGPRLQTLTPEAC